MCWPSLFNVITISCVQLPITLINTFFSKFCTILTEQRQRKANDGYEEAIDGGVDKSTEEQQTHEFDMIIHIVEPYT